MNPDNAKVYDLIIRHKDGIKTPELVKQTGIPEYKLLRVTNALQEQRMIMYARRVGWVVWQKPVTEL